MNGVPWHLYNWADLRAARTPDEWLRLYHEQHHRYVRVAEAGVFGSRERQLDFFDAHGVPGRCSTAINGMFVSFDLNKEIVWQHFEHHIRDVVRARRNHPSILTWSLENELLFVNGRLAFGSKFYPGFEDRVARLAQIAAELDPTRPSYGDGSGDCRGQTPICCQHYAWAAGQEFPAASYRFPVRAADETYDEHRMTDRDLGYYTWDGVRPVFGGEEFFYSGNASTLAWIGGPAVYRGRADTDAAASLYAQIAAQGARWQGQCGFSIWTAELPDARISLEPQAVFVREWNSAFHGGETMARTLKVFNEGRHDRNLTVTWKVVSDGNTISSGQEDYHVKAGEAVRDTLKAAFPSVSQRRDAVLQLTLSEAGTSLFADRKPVCILPRTQAWPGTPPRALAVFDPAGDVRRWLDANRQVRKWTGGPDDFYSAVEGPAAVPQEARVLLVGANAFTEENKHAWARFLRGYLRGGGTAIVLEQGVPLAGDDLPVPGILPPVNKQKKPDWQEFAIAGGNGGRIAFPTAPAHPVFRQLTAREFFTWRGDEIVFRSAYATPETGAICLVQGGDDLNLTAMMEIPVGSGSLLLSQLDVVAKLETEPVADRLLRNMLAWAAARAAAGPKQTLALTGGDAQLNAFLERSGVVYERGADLPDALQGDADILVLKATPGIMQGLAARRADVEHFCGTGRWIMLCNLASPELGAFNRLVGFEHCIRPFRRETVRLSAPEDPLLIGVTDRDVSMLSDTYLVPWKRQYNVSDRVFTAVVDGEEIGRFATPETPPAAGKDSPSSVLTDGLINADFWQFIQYMKVDDDRATFRFDRPETFTRMRIWSAPVYYALKGIDVRFDDGAPVALTLRPTPDMQEFSFEETKASKVDIEVKSHYPGTSKAELVQIDDVQFFRRMPEGWNERVTLLAYPGGIVKYPIGQGGIVLNQLDYTEAVDPAVTEKESPNTPVNVRKKLAIYSALLRNMGATFRARE